MGNFRKIHTIHSFSGFQGQCVGEGGGGVASSNWESEGMGKTCVWNSECMGGGGWAGLDLEFPQGQTRVYSLKMLFSWT